MDIRDRLEAAEPTARAGLVDDALAGFVAEAGGPEVTPGSVLAGPDGLLDEVAYNHFNLNVILGLGCLGYSYEQSEGLTVRQFGDRYLADSYPPPPIEALTPERYLPGPPGYVDGIGDASWDFPIAFVLGFARSGTTLFRAMLDQHSRLWSPGEMHLAQFATMGTRAGQLKPLLQDMLAPECADRLGEKPDQFNARLRSWEAADAPVGAVFAALHQADPATMVVDKTPPASETRATLDRLGHDYPSARFVHLIRNPTDVCRSFVRLQLYHDLAAHFEADLSPYQIAEALWWAHNANIERFLADIAPDRKTVVRYEDLVADPARELRSTAKALGVDFEPAMAEPYANVSGQLAKGAGDIRVNQLRTVTDRPPSAQFFPLGIPTQELARRFGYE